MAATVMSIFLAQCQQGMQAKSQQGDETMTRTDSHRPSTIIPAEYSYVLSYHLATTCNGWPVPPFNVDLVVELQKTRRFASTGGLGQCSVCGTRFIYGDVWLHDSGEHIHIGWECAEKYRLLADRSAFELEADRRKAATGAACIRAHKAELRAAFLSQHEGLEEALKIEHSIITDIASRFQQWGTISNKQIALVMKIAKEATTPKVVETHVPAPTGRQTFRGIVVSTKSQEGNYGVEYKMVVRVAVDESTWLCWSTIPSAMLEAAPVGKYGRVHCLRGAEVEVTATLSPGKDAHFALAKRPIGRVLRLSNEALAIAKEETKD